MDVGSNSVILTVAKRQGDTWMPTYESTAVTALGEGTKTTRLLSERGICDTLDALDKAFAAAKRKGACNVNAAITMAGRIATNTGDFLRRARAQGTPVFVLSAEREAELGFRSVVEDPLFRDKTRLSVIDVGGHSTELATGINIGGKWDSRYRRSFPVGTLGLRETLDGQSAIGPGDVLRLSRLIDDAIGLDYLPGQAGEAVALGATGANLASIRNGEPWQAGLWHGSRLEFEEVARAAGWLCSMSDADRAAVPGIEPGRERTVHLGALLLERYLFALKVDCCLVSERGWRFGLLDVPQEA